MTALLLVMLAATPLSVRVLEREHPVRLHLDAANISCNGAKLPPSLDVRFGARALDLGTAALDAGACTELVATNAKVTLGDSELTRSYLGTLRITLEGSLLKLMNEVDVEDYLPSVVEAEASGAKPAALEAQAVVSRTFALASRRRHATSGYDLCDLSHCQVYRGQLEVSDKARAAVTKTKGLVLLSGSVALRPTFFHAACGGHTSLAQEVFGEETAVGDAVSDLEKGVARCHEAPDFAWTFSIDRPQLAEALGFKDEGTAVEVLRRDEGGRLIELKSFGHRLSAVDFLSRLGRSVGYSQVKSAHFTAEEVEGVVRFSGTGKGHGVGLCQQGARALAEHGVDTATILLRYFPGARLAPAP